MIEALGRWSTVDFCYSCVDNRGIIDAVNHGIVDFEYTDIDNEAGGRIIAVGCGSEVDIWRGSVDNDGHIVAKFGGTVDFRHTTVWNEDDGTIAARHGGTVEFSDSAVHNRGDIIAAGCDSEADFRFDFIANRGAIIATHDGVVSFCGSSVDNRDLIEAKHHGSVDFTDSSVTNHSDAVIEALGRWSTVDFCYSCVDNRGIIDAVNHGIVDFDRSYLGNLGRVEALSDGTVRFDHTFVDNAHGTIAAIGCGSTVELNDATIFGGTLETHWGGLIETDRGNSTFIDLTIASHTDVLVNAGTSLTLRGTIDNLGKIDVDQIAEGSALIIDGKVTLEGSGKVVLDGPGDSIIGSCGGGTLRNESVIEGNGRIGDFGNGDLTLRNEACGVIDAIGTLVLDTGNTVFNAGLIKIAYGGTLDEQDSRIDNSGRDPLAWHDPTGILVHGTFLVDTRDLQLTGHGDVALTCGSEIVGNGSGCAPDTLDNVNNKIFGAGTIGQDGNRALILRNEAGGEIDAIGTLVLATGNTVHNAGLIDIASCGILDVQDSRIDNSGSDPSAWHDPTGILVHGTLLVDTRDLQLTGNGDVALTCGSEIIGDGSACAPDTLDNVNNKIFGTGTIGQDGNRALILRNEAGGEIDAIGTLVLATGNTVHNAGLIQVESWSTLDVQDNRIDNSGGEPFGWFDPTGILVHGTLLVDTRDLQLTGHGDVALTRGSEILGNGDGCHPDTLDNVDNTIFGAGTIGHHDDGALALRNEAHGTIDANVYGQSLVIETGNTEHNAGLFEATHGGELRIEDAVINTGTFLASGGGSIEVCGPVDNSHGHIQVDAGSGIEFDACVTGGQATIEGGRLQFDAYSNVDVTFNDASGHGELVLSDWAQFGGNIIDFSGTDAKIPSLANTDEVELVGFSHGTIKSETTDSHGNVTLTLKDSGGDTIKLHFADPSGTLHVESDSHGNTFVTDPPAGDAAADSSLSSTSAEGSLSIADSGSADDMSASFTATGSNDLGTFSIGPVTTSNGGTSVGWQFDLGNDQINLAPGETVTQSYDLSLSSATNPAAAAGATVSVSIGGSGNDNFTFHPGVGADTIVNFDSQHDTIELDEFSNVQSVQQLSSMVTSDSHGNAVIDLGHNDSITVSGMTAQQLQQVLASVVHLH
ncbi:MAG TPA: hypothetical protein VLV86_03145 [Vicinamibacterales bacterium]|nr:hypothetical protein [Vicinamibacterales bacterium]